MCSMNKKRERKKKSSKNPTSVQHWSYTCEGTSLQCVMTEPLLCPGKVTKSCSFLGHCITGCRLLVSGFPLTDSANGKFGYLVLRKSLG